MNSYPLNKSELKPFLNNFSELRQVLIRFEYRSGFIQRLKDGYGIIHTPRRTLTYGNKNTELLLSLFSDNKSFRKEIIDSILGKNLTSNLISVGFFIVDREKSSLISTFRIIPVNQFLVLIPFRQFNNPPVYIGADSLSFARHIQLFDQPKNILDLATGSGFQLFNLPWQGGTTSMLGLDINPNAVQTGLINSQINNTSWISFEELDIESQLSSLNAKFDLIIGNPPIIPTPESKLIKTRLGGMIHADGGRDGFSVIRSIIPQLTSVLSDNGSLQLILCSLGDKSKLYIFQELENLLSENELKGTLNIIKKIPVELDAYYRGQKDLNEYKRWIKFYKEENATYWYRLILKAEKTYPFSKDTNLKLIQLIRNDFSAVPNQERITIETIKSKIQFYLSDTLKQNKPFDELAKYQNKINSVIDSENWKKYSITDFGKILYQYLPDLFPTEGSAIRFWGQCTNEFWWKPKYLERVLW